MGVDVRQLAERFQGTLIGEGDPAYDEVRRVFNGMIDRRPAVIARCTGVSDVQAAVDFARDNGLLVAVRGGGHHVAGYGTCDGGIVIDLSPMKTVSVDPDRRTARAGGGATWGDFDQATQLHGLATTGGRATTTGVAGQTLGSGSGWLERKLGLTLDNMLAAELVTAGGDVVRASADENPELLWGLRGGGGNFGVVTSFEFTLHPVGPVVLGGMMIFPWAKAPSVLRFWRDYVETVEDEFGSAPAILTAPPAPFVPEHLHGQLVLGLIVCYAGSVEAGEEAVRPFRQLGPEVDLVAPMPYSAIQSMLDAATPPGLQNYWKTENVAALPDTALDVILGEGAGVSSPLSMIVIEPKGRAISRVGDDDTALGSRDAAHTVYNFGMWENPLEADKHVAWTRQFMDALSPFTTPGVSLNFTSDQQHDKAVASFGGPAKYQRLQRLKDTYDPGNLFRLNQNVTPTA
jgi:FAD/FMN-containing dehydrogenase